MVLGKVMAAVSALAIVLSPLLPGLSARAVSQENQETLTSGDMVQATIDQDFGKVTSQVNFDYELLMGNAEGTLSPFIAAETGEALRVKDTAEGDPGRFISSWQIRGGKPDSNVGFRITAKQNIKFSIQFQAISDWASGFFRTLKAGEQIDRTNVAAGTPDAPVAVNKTVEVQLKAGDTLLFYFGNDTTDWQTLSFTASFTADPDGYVPEDTTRLTSGEMVQAVIGANYGKVTSEDNFDYELLMGDAEGTLSPFTHSDSGDTPKVKDAADFADETRFISSFQLRGGRASSGGNVAFRITAKKNIKLSIDFEAKSDWASGYLRTIAPAAQGGIVQIDRTDIAAGTATAPVIVSKTVDVHLRSGETVIFYFGNDGADVQTIYFTALFKADPHAYVEPDPGEPVVPMGKVEHWTSGDMVQAVIDQDMGKVTDGVNMDYELLMGNAQGTLSPFTHSDSGDTPKVKDAAAYADETRFISSFQLRGGKAESNANVVFKMTAKKDIALTIAYEAKSDWASGYLRAVVVDPDGNRGQISSTDIAAGTADAPTVVNKEVVAHLRAGDSLLFYFGNDTADVQTIYFNAQFTADPNAFDPQQVPDTGYNTLLLGFAFVALTAALGTLLAVGKAGKAR